MSKRKTHDEFIEQMANINSNIIILGKYVSNKKKILVKCKICEHEWEVLPSNILDGHGCKKCNIKKNTKTHKEYVEEVNKKNPYIDIIGTYINNTIPIRVRCKHCGEEYDSNPLSILNGRLHRKCSYIVKGIDRTKYRKTHEQFVDELHDINPNIIVIGKYVLSGNKINVKCKICNHQWDVVASSLLQGSDCHICATKKISIANTTMHEEFLEKLHKVNPHIEILDIYTNNHTKVKVKCKYCGHIEYMSPDKLLSRIYNCKACSDNTSFPNRFMASVLDELHINYIPEKVFDWSNNKRYDFYLPDYNMIIEMHGDQHYKKDMYKKTTKQEQQNDKYKYDMACENGIENYFSINSSNSSFDFIWNNLLDEDFFADKLSTINKQTVLERCVSTSKIIELSKYYNSGITKNIDLQKYLGVSKNTISSYMKRAIACKLIKTS